MNIESKTFAVFLFLLFVFPSCSPVAKEQRIAEINDSVFAVSIVYGYDGAEKRATSATAFLVGENLFATAAHVQTEIERMMRISPKSTHSLIAWKKLANGESISLPLEFVGKDDGSDLALYRFDRMKLNGRRFPILKLADRLPDIGEDVVSIGYYGEYEMPFNSFGAVSMIDKDEEIYSDLTLMPGNSGSPLCSLKTGEVFGVNVKVMTIGDGTIRLGIAERAAKLTTLLEKYK